MTPPKTMAGPVCLVCLWLPRLLSGVGGCFDFVGASERLSHMGTTRRKRTLGVCGLEREAYVACLSGFPLHGVHRFESPRLSDMSNRLFVAIITYIITKLNGVMLIMIYDYALLITCLHLLLD
jgi:hypothetical protein